MPIRFADLSAALAAGENGSRPCGGELRVAPSCSRTWPRTGLDREPEVREHATRDPDLIREQSEEQVLDLDTLVSHLAGLVLRAPNRLASLR
jgi:hypothetical protein